MSDPLPEQQPPPAAPAHDSDISDDSNMGAKVTCYPPLGQVTLIARESEAVRFTVLLETPVSTSSAKDANHEENDDLEVSLWHNHNGHHEWSELPLKSTNEFESVLLINQAQDSTAATKKSYFTTTLSGLPKHAHVVRFTLKYRRSSKASTGKYSHPCCVKQLQAGVHASKSPRPLLSPDADMTALDWSWVHATCGLEDGELHYQTNDYQKHSSHSLKHFFPDISSDIDVTEEKAETDETYLYSLTAPVKGCEGQESGYQHHSLGTPAYVY